MKKNMKVAALAVLSILGLAGCSNNSTQSDGKLNIAMLTDAGSITDGSYNQTTWDAITAYKNENADKVGNVQYFQPAKAETSGYEDAIAQAAKNGFNTIICPGFYFSTAFDNVAENYPDINFIGLDFDTEKQHPNVATISYKENESGVLAGYAAVIDGYTKLGFFGGAAQPAPIRYGLGYVYGAYYAAKELGLNDFSIDPKYYTYCGQYMADGKFTTLADGWYTNGLEVIFTAAGGAGDSVIAASDANKNRMIIGVDTDESTKKDSVITSATKGLKTAVFRECNKIYENKFEAGHYDLGIADDCCDVVLGDTARFKNKENTVAKTKAFMEKLKKGEVIVPSYSVEDTTLADFKKALTSLGYDASDALCNAIKGTK